MKIFVITRGERVSTIENLEAARLPYTVITDSKKCLDRLEMLLDKKMKSAMITGKRGCLSARNALLGLVDADEWYCSMDDDLGDATQVHPSFINNRSNPVTNKPPKPFNSWRQIYKMPISYRIVFDHLVKLADSCDTYGATLGGLATLENPWFRANKYSFYKNVTTVLHIAKRGNLNKLKGGEFAHDQWQTAYKMATNGKVLVNKYVHVHQRPFANPESGLGTAEHRRSKLEPALKAILKEFPGLLADSGYPNLRYVYRSQRTLDLWRKENGYIK